MDRHTTCDPSEREPDVSEAMKELFELEDRGLNAANLNAFLDRCAAKGPEYLEAVKLRIRMIAIAHDLLNRP